MTADAVIAAFKLQSAACAKLGSPFMGRLMALFADRLSPDGAVASRVLEWPGDPSPRADNVPLRLAGGLHALRIQGLALDEVYPPYEVSDDCLWEAICNAMQAHEEAILKWLASAPQTNEVRRAIAILPALAEVRSRYPVPFDLIELGPSAGLNLRADRFLLQTPEAAIGDPGSGVILRPDWSGPTPRTELPPIEQRAGIDLNPIDPTDPAGELRLLTYLWPDQPERISRTRAAIALSRDIPAKIERGDAGEWLRARPVQGRPGVGRIIMHTVAAQYFPESTSQAVRDVLSEWGAAATEESPLAHLSVEADDVDRGAGITLTLWPGGERRSLGRVDFHGRWIEWTG